jgi:MFS family permease
VAAVFHVAIAAGGFGGPLINAYVADGAGWRWICGVMAVASGASLLPAALLIRETAYVVHGPRDLDRPADDYPPKRGWVASLSLTHAVDRKASFFGWIGRTVQLMAYPPLWVTGLTVGIFVGW